MAKENCCEARIALSRAIMLFINPRISVPLDEIDFTAVRASGPGGQNVNKVSSAIHLRFDIGTSSLPETAKAQVMTFRDSRITDDGVIIIKAQNHRTQSRNRAEALERLQSLLGKALLPRKVRHATRPTLASKKRRLKRKSERGKTKALRGRVRDLD